MHRHIFHPSNIPISPVARDVDTDWSFFRNIAIKKTFPADSVIWSAGETFDFVFVIENGSVRIDYTNFDGKTLCMYILSNGMLVGEGAVLNATAHNYRCKTLGACTVYFLPAKDFTAALSSYTEFSNIILKQTAQKRLLLMRRLARNSYGDVREKLCHFIYDCGRPYFTAEHNEITIPFFTHQVLSELVGVSRVAVSNCMSQLSQEGLLARKGKLLHIRDCARLIYECTDLLHDEPIG